MTGSPLSLRRREDRESALAWLYESDMTGDPIDAVVERNRIDQDDYAVRIALGVAEQRERIDAEIDDAAQDWSVERMPGIDRALLRMGVWELLHSPEVPTSAIVSEAVALANQYSTDRSAPFVNGVLVTLAERHRSDDLG